MEAESDRPPRAMWRPWLYTAYKGGLDARYFWARKALGSVGFSLKERLSAARGRTPSSGNDLPDFLCGTPVPPGTLSFGRG